MASETAGGSPSFEQRKDEVVQAMALEHYRNDMSSVTAKRISGEVGRGSKKVAATLSKLVDEGAVERLNGGRTTRTQYRLTGADEYSPFRR
jgi:hypothetical protein